jgi:hypothetical protein
MAVCECEREREGGEMDAQVHVHVHVVLIPSCCPKAATRGRLQRQREVRRRPRPSMYVVVVARRGEPKQSKEMPIIELFWSDSSSAGVPTSCDPLRSMLQQSAACCVWPGKRE